MLSEGTWLSLAKEKTEAIIIKRHKGKWGMTDMKIHFTQQRRCAYVRASSPKLLYTVPVCLNEKQIFRAVGWLCYACKIVNGCFFIVISESEASNQSPVPGQKSIDLIQSSQQLPIWIELASQILYMGLYMFCAWDHEFSSGKSCFELCKSRSVLYSLYLNIV